MPELPDLTVYLEHLDRRCSGRALLGVRLASPFLLRTVDPSLDAFRGKTVKGFRRVGKRIVFCFDEGLFLVVHLMIAGRLHWKPADAKVPGKLGLAAFDFADGTLLLTEAGSKRRASLHALRGEAALAAQDPGGIEPLTASREAFAEALRRQNRTLKRALTDPATIAGIGNAYSDEILWRAKLSPILLTTKLTDAEAARLFDAARQSLLEWTEALRKEAGDAFPEHVTAFRDAMAVHGRFRKPCPACGSPVQRIVKADNETNYCVKCQTGG
ncbi:MAG: formamidopyrimidine-DNA glycosylase, partial [Planctomycetes bacterium]|nr:formamidopyrimidine-DNA glycosylase [Planctomycetota bacterium]